MNTSAHAIELRNDINSLPKRLIGALLLAFLLLNATMALARADSNNPFPGTQNDFTSQCRALGGTPHREDTHVVSCTWPNGGKQTCDFNQKPNTCTYTPPPKNSPAANGNVTPGNIEQVNQNQISATDGSQTGGIPAGDVQVVSVESSGPNAPLGAEEPSVSNDAPATMESGDVSTLPEVEGEGS